MQTNDFSNLPNSWQIKPLNSFGIFIRGVSYKKEQLLKEKTSNSVFLLRANNIQEKLDLADLQIVPKELANGKIVQDNDIIFAMSSGSRHIVGKNIILQNLQDYSFGAFCGLFRITNKDLNSHYLAYFLQSDFYKKYIVKFAKGTNINNLRFNDLENLSIPLPPLEIQKRIVARLESAFEKIEKGLAHLQNAKIKLAKYKQSLLKSAFDGTLFCHTEGEARSISNQEFRDISLTLNMTNSPSLQGVEKAETIHKVDCHDLTSSNLAMTDKENPKLPQGWTIKTLGEIAQTTSGGTPSRKKLDYWNGNIKWLKSGELNDNYINEVEETITQSGLENSSAKIFSKGTLLIALYGATIGKLGILNLETSTNQAVCAIMPNKELETKYLFHFLFSIRNKMIKDAFGGAQSNISQTYLKQIKIPLPPLETQKQIVQLLEKHLQHTDKTGEFIESALNKAKQLKQSLLKSAFLGKLT